MEVYKEIVPLKNYLNDRRSQQHKVGLVPTMGALHEGHISLIKASITETDTTVCSVFVNPTQFNSHEDLEKYPRSLQNDLDMLKKAGCHAVFCPDQEVIYHNKPKIHFKFDHLDNILEGRFRPGHFDGVGLIVSKLFNIVNPDIAYFGQKDLQQFMIIQQVVNDLSFGLQLRRMPIIREDNGLAMSSRNKRLSPAARSKASVLYQSLKVAQKTLQAGQGILKMKDTVKVLLEGSGIKLEYLEVIDVESFNVIENDISAKTVAVCVAGYLEEIRLIDNVIFKLDF